MQRRDVVKSIAVAAAGVGLLTAGGKASSAGAAAKEASTAKAARTPFIVTRDGTNLFYKDWGHGRPVVLLAAWCLNSDAWDYETNYLTDRGVRCIAYDRRGHGRSSQPGGRVRLRHAVRGSGGGDRAARSSRRHLGRSFDGRGRGGPISDPPRFQPRHSNRARSARAAFSDEDCGQSRWNRPSEFRTVSRCIE